MSRTIAHLISWVFNPGFLVFATIVTALAHTDIFAHTTKIGWLLILLAFALFGGLVLVLAWTRGMVLDADLATPVRLGERSQILLVFLAPILLMLIVTFRLGQPQPLHAMLVTLVILGIVIVCITLLYKISLHMTGVAMMISSALFVYGLSWWPIAVLVPVIAWARLRLSRHTPYQLTAGVFMGFAVTAAVFRFYGLV